MQNGKLKIWPGVPSVDVTSFPGSTPLSRWRLVIARGKKETCQTFTSHFSYACRILFFFFSFYFFELLLLWEAPIAANMTDKMEEGSNCLPVRLWGLNPLFWCHVKMFVKEVQSLEEYSDYKGICGCMLNEPTTFFYKLMGPFSNLPQLSYMVSNAPPQ